jgi:hypothetical protein
LAEANEALNRLRAGKIQGAAVLVSRPNIAEKTQSP